MGINNYPSIAIAINSPAWYDVKDPNTPGGKILRQQASDLVYRLLSNVKLWASFSTTLGNPASDPQPWQEWISLEYLHNNLHVCILLCPSTAPQTADARLHVGYL